MERTLAMFTASLLSAFGLSVLVVGCSEQPNKPIASVALAYLR